MLIISYVIINYQKVITSCVVQSDNARSNTINTKKAHIFCQFCFDFFRKYL